MNPIRSWIMKGVSSSRLKSNRWLWRHYQRNWEAGFKWVIYNDSLIKLFTHKKFTIWSHLISCFLQSHFFIIPIAVVCNHRRTCIFVPQFGCARWTVFTYCVSEKSVNEKSTWAKEKNSTCSQEQRTCWSKKNWSK